jgi:transposase
LNTLGFMNSQGSQVKTYTKEGTINAEFVLNSIDNWIESIRKLSVLVLDNAKIHHAKIFQEAIKRWEEKGLYIFFLPPYSPHLNRIETLWRESKYRWIKPQDYQSLETIKLALDKIWESFGTNYQINFK